MNTYINIFKMVLLGVLFVATNLESTGQGQSNVTQALGITASDKLASPIGGTEHGFGNVRSGLQSAGGDCFLFTVDLTSSLFPTNAQHAVYQFRLNNTLILSIGVENRDHWFIKRNVAISSAQSNTNWVSYEIYDDLGFDGKFTFIIGHHFIGIAKDVGTSGFRFAPVFFGMDSNLGTFSSHAGEFTGETSTYSDRRVYVRKTSDVWKMALNAKMATLINALNSANGQIQNARFANQGPQAEKLEEDEWETNLAIYPNPSKQVFQIDLSLEEGGDTSYKVFDLSGKLLIKEVLTLPKGNTSFEINKRGELKSGTYLIKIVTPNFSETRRVIVK